jgi:hypothetical protein
MEHVDPVLPHAQIQSHFRYPTRAVLIAIGVNAPILLVPGRVVQRKGGQ